MKPNALILAASITALSLAANASEPVAIDYLALETGKNDNVDTESRLTLKFHEGIFSYHGCHMMSNLNQETYFSNNRLMLGKGETKLLAQLKCDSHGLVDEKYGLRNQSLPKVSGANSGFIDLCTGKMGEELTAYLGWKFGRRTRLDWTYNVKKTSASDLDEYIEMQLNRRFGKNTELFYRHMQGKGNTDVIGITNEF